MSFLYLLDRERASLGIVYEIFMTSTVATHHMRRVIWWKVVLMWVL